MIYKNNKFLLLSWKDESNRDLEEMQLTKLEAKGFKSFGDKITIHFNNGVTAIVGPNGCGKSNVVDAIRWVLGEQSTKMLRSEKMENIIFNGTKNRKPANLAEVSLSFDNTKNILATAYSQVTITRKLYRNGDSEYRLNDVKCRLKDITDLFLDTGIGPDSYSIIELKMIDEIINNKENSRRNLFEEASGVAKYKTRKKQTLNKLRDTQTDLDRVEDLLFEIEKNLKTLENQAKKAAKYLKVKDQYKQYSIALARMRIQDFQLTLNHLEQDELTHRTFQVGIVSEIHQLESELQALKQNNLTHEKNLATQQKITNDYVGKIRTYESDKKIKNEQLKNLQTQENRLTEELAHDKQQINHVGYNVKRIQEELLGEETKLTQCQGEVNAMKSEVEELRGMQHGLKAKLEQSNAKAKAAQETIYNIEKEISILKIQQETLDQERLRNTSDTQSREAELDTFNRSISELLQRQESVQDQHQLVFEQEEALNLQISQQEQLLQSLKEEISRENRLLDANENEYNLTKSLVDNLEGFPESIRFLRKHAGWKKQHPLFSDVLFCKEDYRIAIENYLDPVMNHYVVDTQDEAVNAIQLLRESSRGRAQFFILDAIPASNSAAAAQLKQVEGPFIQALDIIRVDERYKLLCQALLRDVYLINSTQYGEAIELPYPEAIVLHPEGKFGKFKLGIAGGSVGLFEGKRIGRAKNLENLTKEIKFAKELLNKLNLQVSECTDQIEAAKKSRQKELLNELDIQLNQVNQELVSVRIKQEQYQTFISNSQNRKQDIELKIKSIQDELLLKNPLLIDLQAKKSIEELNLKAENEAYLDLSDQLTAQSNAYNQENLRFHQLQNAVSSLNKDLDYRFSQQDALESRINRNSTELDKTKKAIQETLQHVDHSDEDLLAMYVQRDALEKGLAELNDEYIALRQKEVEIENKISESRKSGEKTAAIIAELKEKENALKIDLNTLKERLSIEFNIDIRDLLEQDNQENDANTIPDTELDLETLIAKTEKLKAQLNDFGSINSMALEAYEEMNERYTFILKEKQDLLDAKDSLLDTIKEIDDVAKDKFMVSFNQVRENFIQVFRSLFNEEDSCDLILTQPTSPLESDIDIIARPKGKRPLSINQLSGGEKTLTSTALLFSLYLLKPAPFCIFDEVDAPLDDTNIDKFNNIIRKFSNKSQFIVVSHNKRTIASTDIIYGVTMVEQGVSRVVAVDLKEVSD